MYTTNALDAYYARSKAQMQCDGESSVCKSASCCQLIFILLDSGQTETHGDRVEQENSHSCLTTPCPLQTETQAQCPSSASTFKYIFIYKKRKRNS